jgi:hypothetical protein
MGPPVKWCPLELGNQVTSLLGAMGIQVRPAPVRECLEYELRIVEWQVCERGQWTGFIRFNEHPQMVPVHLGPGYRWDLFCNSRLDKFIMSAILASGGMVEEEAKDHYGYVLKRSDHDCIEWPCILTDKIRDISAHTEHDADVDTSRWWSGFVERRTNRVLIVSGAAMELSSAKMQSFVFVDVPRHSTPGHGALVHDVLTLLECSGMRRVDYAFAWPLDGQERNRPRAGK